MANKEQVRLKDIADRLDVAEITVSKALRDHPDIADSTREEIKRTARQMGYVPNLIARSLSSGETRTIGVVVPEIAHSFFGAVLAGIHQRADEAGYDIILTVSEEDAELETRHIETLLGMRVDGLLISVSQGDPLPEIYELVRKREVPLVFFDRCLEGSGFSSVTNDDRSMARTLTEHALGAGYTRLAHIAGPRDVAIARDRRRGFAEVLRAQGVELPEDWIVEEGFDRPSGRRAARKLLKEDPLPDAVVTVSVPTAMGFYDVLTQAHPDREDEIPALTFGHWPGNLFFRRQFFLAGIDQRPREIGRTATSVLLSEIREDDFEERHVTVGFDLMTAENSDTVSNEPSRPTGPP